MEYVALINALLPLVANLEPLAVGIIHHIQKEQPGQTLDQILDHAQVTLDDDVRALLAEKLRLQGEIDAQTT